METLRPEAKLIKIFQQRELAEARSYAAAGGQALHLISGSFADARPDAPRCFKGQRQIAHLFDQSIDRLQQTARRLGVRVLKVERIGTPSQHLDLCGKPLERAMELARQ